MRRFLWATIFIGLTGISGILLGAPGSSTGKAFNATPNARPVGIALDTATSIIWVDASAGIDANAGTFASPVKTIKKALTIATDTIAVRPGTYNAALGETFPITVQSGIKLVSTAGAASTVIDATGANSRVIHCTGNNNTTLVDGFTIKGGFYQPPVGSNATGGGIFTEGGDQTTFSRCIITGNEARGYNGDNSGNFGGGIAYGGGMGINGATNTVINCIFSNNIARGGNGFAPATIGYPGGDAHGGGAWDGATAAVFTNNTFYGNQSIGGNGANAISGTSNGGAGGSALYGALDCTNCSATNNIVSNNSVTGGTGGAGFGGGSNGGFGLTVTGGILVTTATNNLYYNNTGGDGTTGTNPITGQNPLFVNPSGDLHLKSSSPAKYAGTSTGQPAVDLDNNPRPFGPTIGAYELGLFPVVIGGIGRVTITWSGVDGASSYNLYYAAGGATLTTADAKITGATSPYVFGPVLNASSWSFALTAVENGVEGPIGPSYGTSSAPVCSGPSGPWGTAATSGNSWTNLTRDLANGNTLYATATDSVGLYKSTDAGDTWTPLTGPFNGLAVHAVTANGSTVLATGAGNIYRSTNGGSTWTTVVSTTSIGETLKAIAIDPLNTSNVYAGDFHIDGGTSNTDLLAKSTDGGATFHNITDSSATNLRGYKLLIDSSTSGTLYAGGSGSPFLAKSTNNGTTWTNITPGGAGYPQALALAPSLTSTLYFSMLDTANASSTGVWKSTNSGTSFTQVNNGLGFSGAAVNALLVDPTNPNHVHAGLADGYYVTTDGGSNWSSAAAGQGSHAINAFAQTTTRRLIATTTADRIIMLPLDPAPTISADASPASGNPVGGGSVTISGTGFNAAAGLRVLFGSVDGTVNIGSSNSTSISVTTPAHAPGAVDVWVINPDGQAAQRTNGFTYAAGTISLNAMASSGQVSLSWTAAGGATSYQIRRSSGGGYSTLTSVSGLTYNDTAVSNATGYLYQIIANTGAYSNVDLAVPMAYTDPSLTSGNLIKAAHFTELRTAVNAARTAVGLSALTFTDASLSGATVKRVHLIELRSGLDAARSGIGLSAISYTDPTVTAGSTTIKAAHILELRNGLQ